MLGSLETGWIWLQIHFREMRQGLTGNHDALAEPEISERIRARYDTARKNPDCPDRNWMRERGVLDDWNDAWRTIDR